MVVAELIWPGEVCCCCSVRSLSGSASSAHRAWGGGRPADYALNSQARRQSGHSGSLFSGRGASSQRMMQCMWKVWLQAPQAGGQSSPATLQPVQGRSNSLWQMPQTSPSGMSQRQEETKRAAATRTVTGPAEATMARSGGGAAAAAVEPAAAVAAAAAGAPDILGEKIARPRRRLRGGKEEPQAHDCSACASVAVPATPERGSGDTAFFFYSS